MSKIGSNARQSNRTIDVDGVVGVSAKRPVSTVVRLAILAGLAVTSVVPAIIGGCASRDENNDAPQAVVAGPGAGLVISQVYSTGGVPGAAFKNDFVEIFNASSEPQSLEGLSLQFALGQVDGGTPSVVGGTIAADGGLVPSLTVPFSGVLPAASRTVPAGGYLLLGFSGTTTPGEGAPLPFNDIPTPDGGVVGFNVPSAGGTVAIVRGNDPLACGGPAAACSTTSERVVDLVGYGTSAGAFEGSPVTGFDQTKSVARTDRCVDRDNNAGDLAAGAPTPHGKSTPVAPCSTPGGVDGGADAPPPPPPPPPAGPLPKVVISNIYAGGGELGAPYRRDFVEIYNPTDDVQSLAGISIQFASADGVLGEAAGGINQVFVFAPAAQPDAAPGRTLAPGARLAVILGGSTKGNGADYPVTPFSQAAVLSLNVGLDDAGVPTSSKLDIPGAGKVALVQGTAALGCGSRELPCKNDPGKSKVLVDFVGYGNQSAPQGTASEFEGTGPAATSDATHALIRNGNGCTDSGDNKADLAATFPTAQTLMAFPVKCSVKVAGDGIVISQFYTAGGFPDSEFNRDFVELFNRSAFDQDLTGLALAYGSSDGTLGAGGVNGSVGNNIVALPPWIMKPGTYVMIGLGSPANPRGEDVPFNWGLSQTASAPLDMDTVSGKIALVRGNLPFNCGTRDGRCTDKSRIIDMVGYGSQASDFEGSAGAGSSGALGPSKIVARRDRGCTDTGDNQQDFEIKPADHRFVHNTGSAAADCTKPEELEQSGTYPTAGGTGSKVINHDAGAPTNGASSDDSGCTVSAAPGSGTATAGLTSLFVGLALALGFRRRKRS
jgi:hypothetical protein